MTGPMPSLSVVPMVGTLHARQASLEPLEPISAALGIHLASVCDKGKKQASLDGHVT